MKNTEPIVDSNTQRSRTGDIIKQIINIIFIEPITAHSKIRINTRNTFSSYGTHSSLLLYFMNLLQTAKDQYRTRVRKSYNKIKKLRLMNFHNV